MWRVLAFCFRSVTCWSPCISDTDPVKQEDELEGEKRLGVRERRRGRRERRSTGIAQPGEEVTQPDLIVLMAAKSRDLLYSKDLVPLAPKVMLRLCYWPYEPSCSSEWRWGHSFRWHKQQQYFQVSFLILMHLVVSSTVFSLPVTV